MAVEDVQQLLDLLALSPDVTELTVHGAGGSSITIKRQPVAMPVSPSSIQREPDEEFLLMESEEFAGIMPPVVIYATLVGLFHEASPPALPGTDVVQGQIVGYIESMRLMNEVVSTVDGVIEAVVGSEGQPVEYGQPLFSVAVR